MARVWSKADQEIADKKQYFVVTVYIPWATPKRSIKHAWGPGSYAQARRRKKEAEAEFKQSGDNGAFVAEVIRWRGTI